MSKSLIIAEKPSVAQDIVRALTSAAGKFDKHDEYFENERYVVTSAVGHLVEIKAPEEYDVKRGKWSFAHLPVIPPHFDLAPIDKAKTRLNAVVKLIKRKDVTDLINACDAGPRGRADLPPDRAVRRRQGPSKPVQAAVAAEHDAGRRSAKASSSCAATSRCWPGRRGAQPLRGRLAGRHQRHARDDGVQLARRRLLPDDGRPRADADPVDRGRARGEDPQARLARLLGDPRHLRAQAGQYDGKWFDPKCKKDEDDAERARRPALERAPTRRPIADAVRGQPARVTEEAKPSTQASPLLYDLTTLQREANSRFGFSAKTTLSLAQALYEKHKVLTYPRTDSRALPEDYVAVGQARPCR